MPQVEDLEEKLEAARRALKQIPGVVGVGFGYREKAGQTTQELRLRVYVREKKPLSDLRPEDVVPGELFGIQTDVITVPLSQDLSCEILDSFSTLAGGILISNMKAFLAGTPSSGFGTLGFFGTLNGASKPRDSVVLLTNQHVLVSDGGVNGDTIYQPKLVLESDGRYTPPDKDHLHPIGSITNVGLKGAYKYTYPAELRDPGEAAVEREYHLDCGMAKINTCYSSWCNHNWGTAYENRIHNLDIPVSGQPGQISSAVKGVARISSKTLPSGADYAVYKVGSTSGKTKGKVKDVYGTVQDGVGGPIYNNVLMIENTGPNCENGVQFAAEGDSGAVIVNEAGEIVGLLFGGNDAVRQGHASHIHPVLQYLNISLISTSYVPAGSGVSALLDAPVTLHGGGGGEADTRALILRERILRSEEVQIYRALVERHRDEVVHLVNRVRPVTVAWHRAHGPDYLAHVLHASRHAGYQVPREIQGVSRTDAWARLRAAFEQHGSAMLRADLEQHADRLQSLLDADNVEALAERLEIEQHPPSKAIG